LKYSKILDEQKAPKIFYTPRNGGHWVFRRYDHVRAGYGDSDLFSTKKVNIPPLPDMPLLLPQAIDPPKHQRYRRLLNPLFSPAAIAKLQGWIRGITAELLEVIAPAGHCDFVEDFAVKLPTTVFLKLMGLPLGDLPQFLIWEHAQFRGPASRPGGQLCRHCRLPH
jgi:cytochrome P450